MARGRILPAIRTWVSQTWGDFVSSVDAGLLGMVRFVGLIYGPIDRRLPINEAWRKALRYRLPSHVGWRHALGGISYLLLIILVVTGVLLALYYRPSVEEAYPSIQHIVSEVRFGWLIRDLHVWAASLIIIAVLAHMGRVYFEAAYKPPRETNWTMGLILFGLVLLFGATGYLLPWDQWAYWTVTEVLDAVAAVPMIGPPLADAVKGDVIASGATLSRFFAIHVIVLPWAAGAVVAYHFTLVRRRKLAPPVDQPEEQRHWRVSVAVGADEPEPEETKGIPFYPNHLLRSFMVAATTVAIVLTLAILFPRPIGDPADPGAVPSELVSTWVPVDVSIALIRLIGPIGFALFTLMGLSLAFLPLFDRGPERRWRKRPVATALGIAFFAGFVALWIVGRAIGSVPPTGRTAPPESRLEALPRVEAPGPNEGSPIRSGGGR